MHYNCKTKFLHYFLPWIIIKDKQMSHRWRRRRSATLRTNLSMIPDYILLAAAASSSASELLNAKISFETFKNTPHCFVCLFHQNKNINFIVFFSISFYYIKKHVTKIHFFFATSIASDFTSQREKRIKTIRFTRDRRKKYSSAPPKPIA